MHAVRRKLLWILAVLVAGAAPHVGAQDLDPATVTLEQVRERVSAAPAHPRLIFTAADFEAIRRRADENPRVRALAGVLRRQADALLDQPPVVYEKTGRRLLHVSRRCNSRVSTLAMVYRLTEDPKYLERARAELLAPGGFPDWNPSHFLDTAEMTLALALGYDWLYDDLTPEDRAAIRDAIVRHGLEPARAEPPEGNGWIRADNNWGQVCHGGITAGALALLEDDPDRAAYYAHRAVRNVLRSTAVYAPNGTYPEGPGYWSYGTTFNVILIACLQSSLATDFGLARVEGFDQTAAFLNHATGPTGRYFNFADASPSSHGVEPALVWLARRFERLDWLQPFQAPALDEFLQRNSAASAPAGPSLSIPFLMGWLPEDVPASVGAGTALHWHGKGGTPVTLHRTSWTDPNAAYIGLKGGSPAHNHGHMDIGSFVMDADGVRWAHDLGSESYHGIESRGMNLWDRRQNSDRWTIYRLNNFSHNTLVIDGRLQTASGSAPVVRFSDEEGFPHSVVDMSPVFEGQAATAHRGVALAGGGQAIIRDRLDGVAADSRIRWGMVTTAEFLPGESGSIAVLRQDGRSLRIRVDMPKDATLTTYDTETPVHEWDTANRGTRMVGFEVDAPGDGPIDLLVVLTPGSLESPPSLPESARRPPLEWSAQLRP